MSSIVEGYSYDVFISYRQKDNKYDGWVTEFVSNLKRELDTMFKDEVSVYFDINPSDYLLESYDVDGSLKEKLKCLILIPIISRTYCDPKAFAWDNELKAFVNIASGDQFGFKVRLPNGNIANRVLPIKIHDLDIHDIKLFESVVGGVMRSIDFVYKETGVNRQLRAKDDDIIKSPGQILYRDQINKVALAIRDIIESMKSPGIQDKTKEQEIKVKERNKKPKILPGVSETDRKVSVGLKPEKDKKISGLQVKTKILIPGILIIIAICVITVLWFNHRGKINWAKGVALPEIERFYNETNLKEAYNLAWQAEKYIPDDPRLKEWLPRVTRKVTILTDPPGANVYIRDYSDINGEWNKIGTTPIDSMKFPWWTFYQIKLQKAGYDTILAATITSLDTLYRKLIKTGDTPPGMVYVDGYWDEVKKIFDTQNGFFMDRFEVTNKQYKEFVDNGGYRNRDFWKNKIIKNDKTFTWEEAMAEFTDKTGRPGPSTWEASDYPDGQDDYPVSGVSWYEAAAYSEYAGKELPTADHWDSGAGFYWNQIYEYIGSKITPISNFNGSGPEPVGKNKGLTAFGAFDMAGNVREWNSNETNNGRIISGAGYDDATYLFSSWNQLPPFDRSPQNGFRCVKLIDKEKIPESAFRKIDLEGNIDFSKATPVPENIFEVYKNQFRYDSVGLNAKTEERYESANNWIVEKVSFDAAYNNEKMTAYLYLPKSDSPPFQTLVFFPGSYAGSDNQFNIEGSAVNWFFDYILKSGRAILYPVYYGTFDRKDGQDPSLHSHQYTEQLIKLVKDFNRSIDYLETRNDIEITKLGFYGHSWGGMMGGIIPAVEERLKLNILVVGGFIYWGKPFPEADAVNYIPRIKTPTLMLNGRFDYRFPLKTNLLPFYNLLGTPEKDKRLCIYETDHYVSKTDMIKEVLGWLDKYLGPVDQ